MTDEIDVRAAELATMQALAVIEVVASIARHHLLNSPEGSAGAIVAAEVLDAIQRNPERLTHSDVDETLVLEEEP